MLAVHHHREHERQKPGVHTLDSLNASSLTGREERCLVSRHIMGQGLFFRHMRLGLLLSSTDATAYWQKRARILDR